MKKLATTFAFVGFIIQYIVPIVIFGDLVPFTRDGIGKCLTGFGYIAIALALFFATKKLKEWILQKPKSIMRGIVLSVFPIVWWFMVLLCVDWVGAFLFEFSNYWSEVLIFILLGRGCSVVSEALSATEGSVKNA